MFFGPCDVCIHLKPGCSRPPSPFGKNTVSSALPSFAVWLSRHGHRTYTSPDGPMPLNHGESRTNLYRSSSTSTCDACLSVTATDEDSEDETGDDAGENSAMKAFIMSSIRALSSTGKSS